jgi:hypothetical protein
MILSAHQSSYLPWLGFFHKIYLSETFVFFNSVQYSKKDFSSRNLIKTSGGTQWLTIPTITRGLYTQKIYDVRIENNYWQKKHFKSILNAYNNSKFFDYYSEKLSNLYNKKYKFLVDANLDFTKFFFDSLGINTKTLNSTDFNWQGTKNELIVNMCKELDASDYIFGELGNSYVNKELFESNGIRVHFQKYNHPAYSQLHGTFIPRLSVLDLLLNEGPGSLDIILAGNLVKLPNAES